MRFFLFFLCSIAFLHTDAQSVYLKFVTPQKNQTTVSSKRQFITGTTCKECSVSINQTELKVWPT